MSLLSQYLVQNQFCIFVEYLTSTKKILPVPEQIAGFPVCMTLADRVHSDHDMSSLQAADLYPQEVEKLLHYAGKGRDIADFEQFLTEAANKGQRNLLLLTGDKLDQHQSGDDLHARTRYLESVNAVMAAKRRGGFQVGVAFNPFKYATAEKDAQYFKLVKKLKAGADFIITQLGYDLSALKTVKHFLTEQHYQQKIFACVMPLTLARANFMVKHQVAGIVITPHMLQVLKEEQEAGLTDQVYLRCALQILMCQHLGYSGVHLSACHQPEEQQRLAAYIEEHREWDFDECLLLWNRLWKVSHGQEFCPEKVEAPHSISSGQIVKYQSLHFMHEIFFQSKIAKGIGSFIFKSNVWVQPFAGKALLKTEFVSKHALLGCESCGQCRIAETLYICPETCPKGLANGPCGGTTLDRCEFGDRECIHSVKARLAKAVSQTELLKTALIPTVAIETRGTSSWKNWFIDVTNAP